MKRISELIISILVIGVIIYAFQVKADRDQLILTGKEILLELAPVDPLSLLQGQYMIINFALEREKIEVKEEDINSGKVWFSASCSVFKSSAANVLAGDDIFSCFVYGGLWYCNASFACRVECY